MTLKQFFYFLKQGVELPDVYTRTVVRDLKVADDEQQIE